MSDFHTLFQSRDALYELVDFVVGFTKVRHIQFHLQRELRPSTLPEHRCQILIA